MYDFGIVNGYVYIDGKFYQQNIYGKDGKISAITKDKMECSKVLEAEGKYILPGLVDPHVHFALGVGSNISKDDFYTGSMEAALGGITTYIDFLDPIKKADEIAKGFSERSLLAQKSIVDYAFHTTIANPTDTPQAIIEESKKFGINSIKLFTTYADTDRRTYDDYIWKLLVASQKEGAVVVVHAEHDDLIKKNKDIAVKDHERARPAISENIEVMKLAQMAKKTGGNLYIVHVSAGSSVKELSNQFQEELASRQIILESCPHYFLLNSSCLEKEDGYKYTMTPPIRPEEERLLLHEYRDLITTIGTDHCPYTKEQKEHLFTSEIPMGIGGIRYSFLNMYNLYGFEVLDKFTSGPVDAYQIPNKGRVIPGFDADIVIFDSYGKTVVDDEMSVYNKKELRGRIETVLVRGSVVADKGSIIPHNGRYIRRGGCL